MQSCKADLWSFKNHGLVIPTNLEGAMGRGIARQVNDRWPSLASRYRKDGLSGSLSRSYFGVSTICSCNHSAPMSMHQPWCDSRGLPVDKTCLHFYTPELAQDPAPSEYYKLIMFPTKRVWKDGADLSLIRLSLLKLANLMDYLKTLQVVIPQVGCGYGELQPASVIPIVVEILGRFDDRVTLVLPDPSLKDKYPESFKPSVRTDKSLEGM